jgi:hypothetical protein
MSDDNKPIFIDPKKYPSPHMIIYEPVTDYKVLEKFEEIAINHNGDVDIKGMKNGKSPALIYTMLPSSPKTTLESNQVKSGEN